MNSGRLRFPADPVALQKLLLHHGACDRPTAGERERSIERILAAGTAATAATTLGVLSASLAHKGAAVSSAKMTAVLASKWALVSAVAATAVVGAETAVYLRSSPAPSVTRVAVLAPSAHRPELVIGRTIPDARDRSKPPLDVAERLPHDGATVPPSVEDVAPLPTLLVPALHGGHRAAEPSAPRAAEASASPATPSSVSPSMAISGSSSPSSAPPLPPEEERDRKITPSLTRELAFLDEARRNLLKRAPLAALAALTEYGAAFPAGTLRIEAAALRVEALAAAGRRQEAASLAHAFLGAHPESPLADRIRALVPQIEATRRGE